MALTRWPTLPPFWNQFSNLQSEVNRLFDRWGGNGNRESAVAFPPINVWEDENHLFIEAELPGLDLNDLEMYVTAGNQLSIKGERKMPKFDKGMWHRQERGFGSFVRVVTLPFQVDREKVDAKFEHGVLQVKLAKAETAKPLKILVKSE